MEIDLKNINGGYAPPNPAVRGELKSLTASKYSEPKITNPISHTKFLTLPGIPLGQPLIDDKHTVNPIQKNLFENKSGLVAIQQDASFEAARLEEFLKEIKKRIDPQIHPALIRALQEEKSLDPDPFFNGIAWRNKIKEHSPFQNQPLKEEDYKQQENYIRGVLRQVKQAYCEVYHLPYREDANGRIEIAPAKEQIPVLEKEKGTIEERINSLLAKAEITAQQLTENPSPFSVTDSCIGDILRLILPSTLRLAPESSSALVERCQKAYDPQAKTTSQERINILREVREKVVKQIGFDIDSNIETLQNNFIKKEQLISSIARLIQLEQQRSTLAEKALAVGRLEDWEFFKNAAYDNLGLKDQRQAALDRIQQLAPNSLLLEKIKNGTLSIDREAITELVNTVLFNQETLNSEGISIEQAQAELKSQIFQYFCHNIAFKFNQTYYEVVAIFKQYQENVAEIAKKNPEVVTDQTTQQIIYSLSALQEKLRYMTFFLEFLSRNDKKIQENSTVVESSVNAFFKRASQLINDINSSLTGGHANYQVANQITMYFEASELNLVKVISGIPLNLENARNDYSNEFNVLGSVRELERGLKSQGKNNFEAAFLHLQAAKFLIKSIFYLSEHQRSYDIVSGWPKFDHNPYSKYKIARQGGLTFALAACRKEWEKDRTILSEEQKQFLDKDTWSSQDYAEAAEFIVKQGKTSTKWWSADAQMEQWSINQQNADANYYLRDKNGSFEFYRALGRRFTDTHSWKW